MAYTGTGTQSDPYVVSTLPDLITCLSGGNVYVKVTADIDCAQEPTYSGKITTHLNLTGNHLYADTNVSIYGLTIESNCFFYCYAYNTNGYIDNVNFINCVFKYNNNDAGSHTGGIFDTGLETSTSGIYTNNSKFSFVASVGSTTSSLFNKVSGTDCAYYVKVINSAYTKPFLARSQRNNYQPYNTFTRCNIIIDGMLVGTAGGTGGHCLVNYGDSSNFNTIISLDSSCLIFKDCDIQAGNSSGNVWAVETMGVAASFISASYVALLGCTILGSTAITINGDNYNMTGSLGLIASDNMAVGTGNQIKPITVANLKDENYLMTIGFLP